MRPVRDKHSAIFHHDIITFGNPEIMVFPSRFFHFTQLCLHPLDWTKLEVFRGSLVSAMRCNTIAGHDKNLL